MIRVGIIGAAYGTRAHGAVVKALPGIEPTAVCSRRLESAKAAAEFLGLDAFTTDYRQVIGRDDVDLVVVGTPPALHAEISIAALEAGKHVVCEAQIATSAKDAARMRDAAAKAGKVNVVNMQARHSPALARMAEMVRQGDIGEPYFAHVTMLLPIFTIVGMRIGHEWQATQSDSQGALGIFVSHCIDPLFNILGKPKRIAGRVDTFWKQWNRSEQETFENTTPDTIAALIDLEGGTRATLDVCWIAVHGPGVTFEVYGSKGRLLATSKSMIEIAPMELRYGKLGEAAMEPVKIPSHLTPVKEVPVDSNLYNVALVYRQVIDAIAAGRADVHPTFEDGLLVQRTLDAIEQSSKERCWQEL